MKAPSRARAAGERLREIGSEASPRVSRGLGEPALFAVGLSVVGSTIYFALGVVAGDALGLTPIAFLLAAVFFVLTTMTYVEGSALHAERGGASTIARYAFNELWSFIAGWAIILDYLIVIAIGAFSVSHYLEAFWIHAGDAGIELGIAAAVIAVVAWTNIRGLTAARFGAVLRIGLLNLVVLAAIIVVGLATKWDPDTLVESVKLGKTPPWDDFAFALIVATAALTGIEAASGLAGEIRVGRRGLRRIVIVGSTTVLVLFVGISVVALTTVPIIDGHTALGGRYIEAPILGVASSFDPGGLRDAFRVAVGAMGAIVIFTAVQGNMLGLSRLAYSLGTHRQIPSAVGKLHPRRSTPYVTILIASALAFVLVLSRDIKFMAGIFAFGAMLTFSIAHLGVIVLRYREPDRDRAFRIPFSVKIGSGSVPLPAVAGVVIAFGAWLSVLAFHEGARYVGGAWMLGGLVLYVVYRIGQGKSLTQRVEIPAAALQKDAPGAEYGSILVPVFGDPLDDDIVGTAGRLAAEEAAEGEGGTVIEAIYVIEIPMSLPLDARVPEETVAKARRALARAKEVGEEYEGVEVATATSRARSVGAAIVDEAKRRGVEAIVLAAEAPTRMRGGALLGGRGGPRDKFIGEMTRFVLEKAPCRVVLTAAPAGEDTTREGVAP